MGRYSREEILELLATLDRDGVRYFIPDTEVDLYTDGVRCGLPTEVNSYECEKVWVPKQLLGNRPIVTVFAEGDSMIGAGINSGDTLTVEITDEFHDGEIVVISINGASTVKVFYVDEHNEKWLLPQNENYAPIHLSPDDVNKIWGKVVSVTQPLRPMSYRQCSTLMKKYQEEEEPELTAEIVCEAIQEIAVRITNSRLWYSPYRVLVERGFYSMDHFTSFAEDVNGWCPDCRFHVNPDDLSKMAVGSFRKKLSLWSPTNAPVTGKRFAEYKSVAIDFDKLIDRLCKNHGEDIPKV